MSRRFGIVFVALVAIAAIAPASAAGRAIADDWMPIGDNGAIGIRAHDVLSTDTPLLGLPTTLGGAEYEGKVLHLGPLLFWSLAIPERIAGSAGWGLVAGAALVAIVAIFATGWAAARVGGIGPACWALALTVVACWSLGRQQLADPWNPYIAVLPIVAALFLAWAAASGDAWALPPLAFTASFAAQAHLLYVPLGVVLFVGAGVAVVVTRTAVRELLTTAGVLGVAWLFPVWEQLTHRPGNMLELSRAFRAEDQVSVSWRYALRAVGRAIGAVPLFARPARDVDQFGAPLSGLQVLTAIAAVVALVVLTVFAVRRRDRVAAGAGCVALVALVVVTVTTAQMPVSFPDVAFYRLLSLWPAGVFAWFALGLLVARAISVPVVVRRVAFGAAAALLAVSVPAVAFADSRNPEDERLMEAVRVLAREVDPEVDDVGPLRVQATGEFFAQLEYGMVRELKRRGIDARVGPDDPYLHDNDVAPDGAATLIVVGADTGELPAENARRLAEYPSWSEADLVRLAHLDADVRSVLAAKGPPELADRDPYELFRDTTLLQLQAAGDLVLSDDDRALFRRYYDARFQIEQLTFAAYLVPAG